MFYKLAILFCRIVLIFKCRIRSKGRENIPQSGGFILALNHRTNYDVLIAGITSTRRLRYMAKAELFKNKFFSWLITKCGAFPVNRGKGDIGAIKSALEKLKNNEGVLMFPEGKRVTSLEEEKDTRAKPGAVMIAIRAQVPIVPAYISGKFGFMRKITISYGKPIHYTEYAGEKQSVDTLQDLSDELMKKIRSLRIA
ncbi:MAG: 1-acyl-sn-glycerol-3-phosphate acyltransferase [Eubacteriales bacterium]|nr:1-acyl-sn-glycerol-3-phosphate acyltransferase [Eubacteriales bacterium]